MKEVLLLLHPVFGVFGIIAAVWVIVETLNASPANERRIKIAAAAVTAFMTLTWVAGGYLYTAFYAPDKAIILAGPWPFAHNFFMESKEHLFFITLVLSFFLPMVIWRNMLAANKGARILVIVVAALVVLSGLALEGAGAVIAMGVKLGLQAGVH